MLLKLGSCWILDVVRGGRSVGIGSGDAGEVVLHDEAGSYMGSIRGFQFGLYRPPFCEKRVQCEA